MSWAWQTTDEDIRNVLEEHGIQVSSGEAVDIYDQLNHNVLEQAIMEYMEMDQQTQAAYNEIENQLIKLGIIPQGEKKFKAP